MPEQEKSTTNEKWLDRQIYRVRRLAAGFEFVREVLIFTFLFSLLAFWYYADNPEVLRYVTVVVVVHIAALAALGITRMIVNPNAAAVRSRESDDD